MKYLYLAAAAAIVISVPAQAQDVGVASAVKNDVRIRKPNVAVARPVMLKQRIAIADTVQTGGKAQLQIVLLDRSIFTVGANAKLTIDRYVYDPARNSRTMGATVGRGSFRFLSGRRTTGSTTINTPTAAIGVRGTIVEGVVGEDAMLIANGEGVGGRVRADPETATLIVLRGPGRGTTANVLPGVIDVTAGGKTVTVDRPMQAIYIPYPGAVPIGPFTISDQGLSLLQALLYPSVATRLGMQGPYDPNRTFTPGPDLGDNPNAGSSVRMPRYPGRGPTGSDPGAFRDEDGPPTVRSPLPFDQGNLPQPQRRPQRQQAAPTPIPAPQPGPNNRVSPNDAPRPTAAPAPTPAPTPTPPPVLKDNVKSPAYVAPPPTPSPSPTPSPTPTPSPNQKPPGKTPG